MNIRNAKQKGKALEKLVLNKIKEAYNFSEDDIRITVGNETGADVKLSAKAKAKFPFSVEIKARKSFDTIYNFYLQAIGHYPELVPLVIIKANYKQPLVILDLDHFITLIQGKNNKNG